MMNLNGVINTLDLMSTKQFSNSKVSEGNSGKDFVEIFQNKLQWKNSNQQNLLNGKSTNIQSANYKRIDTTSNTLDRKEKPLVYNESSLQQSKESIQEDRGRKAVSTKKETTEKESISLQTEEEVLEHYEGVIPPQLLQQLEELIILMQQQGNITKEEAEVMMVYLESEASNPQELILHLDNLFRELDIERDASNIEVDNDDKIKVLKETIKSLMNDLENQSLTALKNEEPNLKNSLNFSKNSMEESTEASKVMEGDHFLEKTEGERHVDLETVEKAVKDNISENTDIEESHIVVDLNKNFELRLNNMTNQPLNTDEIHAKNLMEQLIHKVEGTYKAGKTQLKLQLMPENLGKLSIDLSSENQTIKAKVYVESLQVKEIIESSLNQFKESLREKGLNISSVEVSVGQDSQTFLQNRSFSQQKLKIRKTSSSVIDGIVGTQEESITFKVNPYLASEGFDQLG